MKDKSLICAYMRELWRAQRRAYNAIYNDDLVELREASSVINDQSFIITSIAYKQLKEKNECSTKK